jgi:hypothetical protein
MTRLVAALRFAALVTAEQAQDATYDRQTCHWISLRPSGHVVRRVSAG